MFRLDNVYTREGMTVVVEHGGHCIEYIVKDINNKRNKDELAPSQQFVLLEAYLDYKGDEFKTTLMNIYLRGYEILTTSLGNTEVDDLPLSVTHDVLDLFDLQDVFNFVKNIYRVTPPDTLHDTFDVKMVVDVRGTRVQTYIKDDYLELASLVVILKTVFGPIGHYAYMKSNELGTLHKEYILLNFISTHKIFTEPSFIKLAGLVEKVVAASSKSEDENAVRVIEKQLPREELPKWVLAITVIQKVMSAAIINDNGVKNIVTRIYTFITNKLKVKGEVSNTIRAKKAMTDIEGGTGEAESIVESYRIVSDIPKGFVVEIEHGMADIEKLRVLLNPAIDKKIMNQAVGFTKILLDKGVHKSQIFLLGWVLKEVLDPRELEYVSLESIVRLQALAFAYLWYLDFKYLALYITAIEQVQDEDAVLVSFTANRSRVTKELKEELSELFPYSRVVVSISGNKTINPAEESINKLSDRIFKRQWIFTAYEPYIVDYVGTYDVFRQTPADLKIHLAKLVIILNK